MGWRVMEQLTIEDLQRRRQDALTVADRAVFEKRAAYLALKECVDDVNSRPLDVSEYHSTAKRLAALLEEIDRGTETIFAHFRDQIDPLRSGQVVTFRFECRDLAEQIADLEQWRAEHHRLRVVK